MSRAAISSLSRDRPVRPRQIIALALFISISLSCIASKRADANPLPDLAQEYQNLLAEGWTDNSTESSSTDNSTETNTDVYVVKAVVYEIGILTDTDNATTTDESTERQERVDISLYDPPRRNDEFS